jgi:hypothetical protein
MKTFQIPAQLDSFRSMVDRGIKVTFVTGELSPEQVANIQYSFQMVGFLAFSPNPFATHQLEEIDKLKVEFNDTGKPPSQRLRAVLYRMFEQSPEGYKTFQDFYMAKMEVLIEHFKGKLD